MTAILKYQSGKNVTRVLRFNTDLAEDVLELQQRVMQLLVLKQAFSVEYRT